MEMINAKMEALNDEYCTMRAVDGASQTTALLSLVSKYPYRLIPLKKVIITYKNPHFIINFHFIFTFKHFFPSYHVRPIFMAFQHKRTTPFAISQSTVTL